MNRRDFLQTFASMTGMIAVSEVNRQGRQDKPSGKTLEIQPSLELKTSRKMISLDGQWDFSYDPRHVGESEKWFDPAARLPETTTVPGCDKAQYHPSSGMSLEEHEEFHQNHRNTELTELGLMTDLKYPTLAPAWQRRQFQIPPDWRGEELWLHLGGVMPAADVWFNGIKIGGTVTSRCPVRCNVTGLARFERENTLAVKTYWPDGPRLDGTYEWIGFTGLYRSVRVEAVPQFHIRSLHVVGKIHPPQATVRFILTGAAGEKDRFLASLRIRGLNDQNQYAGALKLKPGQQHPEEYSVELEMPEASLWSPDQPNLYEAEVSLSTDGRLIDTAAVRFGLREVRCEGLRVLLNGKPVYLRGGCDVSNYPETIAPPAFKDFYVKRFQQAEKYGFNYTKNACEVYTQEFLDAADEAGFLVCQEMPFGVMGEYRKRVRYTMPKEFEVLYRSELENIVRSDRNHPSVIIYSMTSEFPGLGTPVQELTQNAFDFYCREMPALAKRLNPTALAIDTTGTSYDTSWSGHFPQGARNTDLIEDYPHDLRTQEPFLPLRGNFAELDRPFLLHEYNCWTSLPEPDLKPRYQKIPGKLNGVPEMEQAAARNGMTEQLPLFVRNSRKLKYLLMKSGLEVARRNPKISGYHMFLINGYSWCQEGVFNEFYEEPKDLSAQEFRTFNNETVLLLDDGARRCFECGQLAPLGIEVSHFGKDRLAEPALSWQLVQGRTIQVQGRVKLYPIEAGALSKSYNLDVRMPSGSNPSQLDLQVTLLDGSREVSNNHWTLWAVPAPSQGEWVDRIATDFLFLKSSYPHMRSLNNASLTDQPAIATGQITEAVLSYLDRGGHVLLLSDGVLKDYRPGVEYRPGEKLPSANPVNYGLFRSPAYNRGTHGNMGTVIADHPALGKLPHEGWCDAYFFHLIAGAYPLLLGDLHPPRLEPIIRSIGHQTTMVDKAYLYEIGVGRGKLLATSLRLSATHNTCPESRYLMECLLSYVASEQFEPSVAISKEKLASMIMR